MNKTELKDQDWYGLDDIDEAYKEGKQIHSQLKKRIVLQESFAERQRNGLVDDEGVRSQVRRFGRVISNAVFKREDALSKGGEIAMSILIDCSGSMGLTKMQDAKQALATLCFALDGIPNVHYEIRGFTEMGSVIDIPVKSFKEKRVDKEKLRKLRSFNGNCDGINMRMAYKRLDKYRNMKRVLFVISDGQPAYSMRDENDEYIDGETDMKGIILKAKRNHIKTVGIGIEGAQEKNIKEIYGENHYFFEKTQDLDKQLTKVILKALGVRR